MIGMDNTDVEAARIALSNAGPIANAVLYNNGKDLSRALVAAGASIPGVPTGAAGGDLSGSYPNPTITNITNAPVHNSNTTLSFRTSNTERMSIDAGGRVRLPYQPRFYILTGAYTFASTSTTAVPFNTALVNIGSHFNTSTYTFTAPAAGTYIFTVAFQKRFSGGLQVYWNKNGVQSRCLYVDLAGDSPHPTSTIMYALATNDTLRIDYNLSSGDIYGGSGTEPFTYFCGHMIG